MYVDLERETEGVRLEQLEIDIRVKGREKSKERRQMNKTKEVKSCKGDDTVESKMSNAKLHFLGN